MATRFRILEKHTEGINVDGEGGGHQTAWIDRGEVTAHNRRQARTIFATKAGKDSTTLVAVLHSEWEEDTIHKKQETVFESSLPAKRLPRRPAEAVS